ncbi:MAG: DUF835 domain-containing protein, partial [Candidatus Thermoplasmatota archaeon]|nr:DUF835 domain-containing protein [Candidatus Thermoplasmatota archaeon]
LDWHDDARCPACGSAASSDEIAKEKDAPLVEEIEAYVSKVECPECAAIIPVEGDERFEVDCPTCGKPLAILPKKLEPGYNYLFLDEEEKNTYRFFSSLLDGRKGLVLTTSFPEKVRREHPLGDSSIIWITDTSSEFGSSMDPRRLDFEVTRTISETTSGEEEAVVLLDGLEYLIVENGFEPVLRFIKKITDIASMDEATLLVLADPETISSDDLSVLKKEFDFVEDFKNLPEDEDVF